MSVFLKATQSGWYPQFLMPVVEKISSDISITKILDIGTGPGKLPQMFIEQNKALHVTGIDIDPAMIKEATRRLKHPNVSFINQHPGEPLPFDDNLFDAVTFCSVLFLLTDNTRNYLMKEARRVLKPEGKIIVLTPSGNKSILSSFAEVWKYPFSYNNYTFIIWKTATTIGGRKWHRQKWFEQYASNHNLSYTNSLAFNNNAMIESISNHANS
jgi:ubiquinone/menaquinone biosynthesis C-methylase UbiE